MSRFGIKACAWVLAIIINIGFFVLFINLVGLDGGYTAQLAKGEAYVAEGDIEKAIKAYTKAINISPDSPEGYFNVADLLMKSNLEEKAIETLEQYIDRSPRVPDAYERLLLLYQSSGRPASDQIELLQKCANLFSSQTYADRAGEIKKQIAFVEAPVPDVEPGTYDISQTIKLMNVATTDTVYYTNNGEEPDKTSTKYNHSKGVSVKKGKTMLRFIRFTENGGVSQVASFLYVIGEIEDDPNIGNISSKFGNNVVSGGYAAGNGSDIVYSNLNASRNIYSAEKGFISNDQAYYINLYYDYIYYVNGSDGNKIYRIKNDGTERQMIVSSNVGMMHVAGTKLIYENKSEGSAIYYCNLDGSGKTKITGDRASIINVNSGYVFYRNDTDGERLYKISLDGIERSKLTEDRVYLINIYENNVYYMNVSEGGTIYRIPCDGGETVKITGFGVAEFCMDDGNIYYRGVDEKGIFKFGLADGTVTKLTEDDGAKLSSAGDYIYYVNYADNSAFYRVGKTGGGRERVAR